MNLLAGSMGVGYVIVTRVRKLLKRFIATDETDPTFSGRPWAGVRIYGSRAHRDYWAGVILFGFPFGEYRFHPSFRSLLHFLFRPGNVGSLPGTETRNGFGDHERYHDADVVAFRRVFLA
jgi:hypothetical protein